MVYGANALISCNPMILCIPHEDQMARSISYFDLGWIHVICGMIKADRWPTIGLKSKQSWESYIGFHFGCNLDRWTPSQMLFMPKTIKEGIGVKVARM